MEVRDYEYCATVRVLIVTLGKSETYKETIKEKSTILPYSIHKRIHVRPQRNLIQGIHVNTIQSTVLKEAAIRNSVRVRVRVRVTKVDFSFIVSLYVSDLLNVTISTVGATRYGK